MKKQRYIFEVEKNDTRKYLAFITLGGHISGKFMKKIADVSPRTIEELKEVIKENPPKIGDSIHIGNFIFLVIKKHFATKNPSNEDFIKMLNVSLSSGIVYKTICEEGKTPTEEVLSQFSNIDYDFEVDCEKSNWKPNRFDN